ncbi:unnamed protein product [Cunninghamella blakesleeana]
MTKVEREISVLRTVRHPYIVKLYDVIETEKYIGIILQCASGGELFEFILAHRYLKEKDASRLFAQLISGVHYMHQKHIVHRDLKLENLLLDRHRNIIITDFGFANQFSSTRDDLMSTSCGSPCYAAPELVISEGLYVGTAVDIWSCGVILYAMLCGYLPFDDDPENPDGDNINLLYKYILNTPLAFPDYVSHDARDLLKKMLVPDPAKRCSMDIIMLHPWLAPHRHLFDKTVYDLEMEAMRSVDLPIHMIISNHHQQQQLLQQQQQQQQQQQLLQQQQEQQEREKQKAIKEEERQRRNTIAHSHHYTHPSYHQQQEQQDDEQMVPLPTSNDNDNNNNTDQQIIQNDQQQNVSSSSSSDNDNMEIDETQSENKNDHMIKNDEIMNDINENDHVNTSELKDDENKDIIMEDKSNQDIASIELPATINSEQQEQQQNEIHSSSKNHEQQDEEKDEKEKDDDEINTHDQPQQPQQQTNDEKDNNKEKDEEKITLEEKQNDDKEEDKTTIEDIVESISIKEKQSIQEKDEKEEEEEEKRLEKEEANSLVPELPTPSPSPSKRLSASTDRILNFFSSSSRNNASLPTPQSSTSSSTNHHHNSKRPLSLLGDSSTGSILQAKFLSSMQRQNQRKTTSSPQQMDNRDILKSASTQTPNITGVHTSHSNVLSSTPPPSIRQQQQRIPQSNTSQPVRGTRRKALSLLVNSMTDYKGSTSSHHDLDHKRPHTTTPSTNKKNTISSSTSSNPKRTTTINNNKNHQQHENIPKVFVSQEKDQSNHSNGSTTDLPPSSLPILPSVSEYAIPLTNKEKHRSAGKKLMDWFKKKPIKDHQYTTITTNNSTHHTNHNNNNNNNIKILMSKPLGSYGVDFNDAKLRNHHGVVDQDALTARPPQEVFQQIKQTLLNMGIDIKRDGSDYKLKCTRKKRQHLLSSPSSNHHQNNNKHSKNTLSSSNNNNNKTSSASITSSSSNNNNNNNTENHDTNHHLHNSNTENQEIPSSTLSSNNKRRTTIMSNGAVPFRKMLMRKSSEPQSNNNNNSNHNNNNNNQQQQEKGTYGDPTLDPGDEVRFSVELCKIKNLPGLYIVDIKRLRGNVWSYKFLYHSLLDQLNLSGNGGYMNNHIPNSNHQHHSISKQQQPNNNENDQQKEQKDETSMTASSSFIEKESISSSTPNSSHRISMVSSGGSSSLLDDNNQQHTTKENNNNQSVLVA